MREFNLFNLNLKERLKLPDKIFGIETDMVEVLIAPTVITLVLFFIILGVVVPKILEINDMNNSIKSLNNQTKDLNSKRAYLDTIDPAEINKKSSLLNAAIINDTNSYVLVGVVKKIAEKHGFSVLSFSVSPGEIGKKATDGKTGVTRLSLSVDLSGPAESYLNLIKGIENSLPILAIDSYEMSSNDSASLLKMSISAFYITTKEEKARLTNLSTADLTLDAQESGLIERLDKFSVVETSTNIGVSLPVEQYTKYVRSNPF